MKNKHFIECEHHGRQPVTISECIEYIENGKPIVCLMCEIAYFNNRLLDLHYEEYVGGWEWPEDELENAKNMQQMFNRI